MDLSCRTAGADDPVGIAAASGARLMGRDRRVLGDRDWRHFERWCRARRLRALPAHPWAVAAYLRWCEKRTRGQAIADCLQAITRVHILSGTRAPDRDPMVERTLRLVERHVRTRGSQAGLFKADAGGEADTGDETGAGEQSPGRRALRRTPRLVRRAAARTDA